MNCDLRKGRFGRADADMTIKWKRKPRRENRDHDERECSQKEVEHERMRQEEALDEALIFILKTRRGT